MIWELMVAFFKIGLFAIGGGLATLPFLYQLSQETGWFSTADIATMIAVSQSTPGPIGINMATYVGFQVAGLLGAISASLALIAPSVIICIAISKILDKVKQSPIVQAVFSSLRPASAALILLAGFSLATATYWTTTPTKATEWLTNLNWQLLVLSGVLFILLKRYHMHPVLLIALAALAGIVFQL